MRCFAFFFFVLLLLSCGSGVLARTGSFGAPSLLAKPLQVRGGAGPLDPSVAAKVATVASLGHGYISIQVPVMALEVYGLKEPSAVAIGWGTTVGAAVASIGVAGLCLFFLKTDLNTAFGWSYLVWVTEHLRAILTNQETKLGADPTGRRIWFLVSVFSTFAAFTEADYANKFFKVSGGILAATSMYQALDTAGGMALYGFKNPSQAELLVARAAAFWLLANGVLVIALASGVEPTKSMGYALIAGFAQCFSFVFISKEVDRLELDKSAMLFWTLFSGVLAATMAF